MHVDSIRFDLSWICCNSAFQAKVVHAATGACNCLSGCMGSDQISMHAYMNMLATHSRSDNGHSLSLSLACARAISLSLSLSLTISISSLREFPLFLWLLVHCSRTKRSAHRLQTATSYLMKPRKSPEKIGRIFDLLQLQLRLDCFGQRG